MAVVFEDAANDVVNQAVFGGVALEGADAAIRCGDVFVQSAAVAAYPEGAVGGDEEAAYPLAEAGGGVVELVFQVGVGEVVFPSGMQVEHVYAFCRAHPKSALTIYDGAEGAVYILGQGIIFKGGVQCAGLGVVVVDAPVGAYPHQFVYIIVAHGADEVYGYAVVVP